MIRQNHLRIPDVKGFLRTFDRHKPLSPDDWAVNESTQYEPGYLIFCLEPVAAPAGLSSFSKRGEDQGETFRVKDLCVVVSKDDGKCVAVIVTPSAYEFRVLDTLLLEKAMKAILDGRDFNYLAARPIQKMDDNAIKALYKLGSEYAKGGSRRTLAVEGATLQEPALALLAQLGAKLSTQVGKQLIDIGSICHMIFTPEGRQEDKSKAIMKSCFVPVRSEEDSAPAAKAPAMAEASLYSVDPLADVAHLQDNYSTEAGNIDLSALAPEPPVQLNYESPIQPLAAPEPSSSFGDFGMGLLSALAPQQGAPQQAMAFENLAEGGRSADLPSLPFGQGLTPGSGQDPSEQYGAQNPLNNMDTLPPTGPSTSFTGLSSMDSLPIPGVTTSMTGLPAMTGMSSMTDTPAMQPPAPPPPAPAPSSPAPNTSMTGLPATTASPASPAPSGNGQAKGAVPEWFIMSHEAVAAPQAAATAPMVEEAPPPPAPKEDFSNQFMNDWEQGHAGSAAVEAAEKEIAQEQQIRSERDKGKESRLREYFGDEHFQKYVKGEISEPEIAKIDSWQLDPSQYKSEPAEEGPNFDADIFANAARSTLETNPDAIVHETPREEITGPPPDPSWSAPTTFDPTAGKKAETSFDSMLSAGGELPVPEKVRSLDESGAQSQSDSEPAVPSLSILDALPTPTSAAAEAAAQPSAASTSRTDLPQVGAPGQQAQELGAFAIPESSEPQPNSLFNHLTGEFSAQQSPTTSQTNLAAQPAPIASPTASQTNMPAQPSPTTSQTNLAAQQSPTASQTNLPAQQSPTASQTNLPAQKSPTASQTNLPAAAEAVPGADTWAPAESTYSADRTPLNSGAMWSAVDPGESLFAAPDEVDATVSGAEAAVAPTAEPVKPAETPAPSSTTYSYSYTDMPAVPASQTEAPASPVTTPEPTSAPASSELSGDAQQPRVRPRDYSSPLRSKTASGVDNPVLPAQAADTVAEVQATAEAVSEAATTDEPTSTAATGKASTASSDALPKVPADSDTTKGTATGTSSSANNTALPFRPKPAAPAKATSGTSDSLANPLNAAAATGTGSQDARLMMNEMTSLMSKLEMQVAKAANKMASRAEELRGRLSQQVDTLVKEAQDVEKQAETNLSTLASELKLKLDNLAADVQTNLAKDASEAQSAIEEIAQNGWDRLDSEQAFLTKEVSRSSEGFRQELDKLTETVRTRLDHLIDSRNKELTDLSENILAQLKESHDQYNQKVAQRFDRFEQRMNEETSSISSSLDRNMRSMVEEIETSLERACEKLKNTKFELEQTVAHTIAVTEMAIAQKAKHLLTETLLPRLNEQKEIIRTMIADMSRQIANESNSGLDAEVAKLEQGTNHAGESLRKVADECVQEVEMTGRGIKAGVEDHFKRASSDLMVRTREVGDKIRETERRMADSEYALKHLAEASTVDSEPELAEERNHAVSKLATLKAEASKQLASTIEQNLESLESKGEHLIGELSNKRSDLTSQVREAAESNIGKVRQALQEATNAIQSAREKHME